MASLFTFLLNLRAHCYLRQGYGATRVRASAIQPMCSCRGWKMQSESVGFNGVWTRWYYVQKNPFQRPTNGKCWVHHGSQVIHLHSIILSQLMMMCPFLALACIHWRCKVGWRSLAFFIGLFCRHLTCIDPTVRHCTPPSRLKVGHTAGGVRSWGSLS